MGSKQVLADVFLASGAEALYRKFFREGRTALFHRVSAIEDKLWPPLNPDNFRSIVRYIAKHYEVVSVKEISEPAPNGKPRIAISFDDGFADFYHTAWPILKEEGINNVNHNFIVNSLETGLPPWTSILHAYLQNLAEEDGTFVFAEDESAKSIKMKMNLENVLEQYATIYGALQALPFNSLKHWIRDTLMPEATKFELPAMMNKAMLLELHRDGLEIGAHGKDHLMLHHFDNTQDIEEEVLGSKVALEKLIGTNIDTYALPNGISNAKACEFIEHCGFSHILFAGLPFPEGIDFPNTVKVHRTSIHHNHTASNKMRISLNMR